MSWAGPLDPSIAAARTKDAHGSPKQEQLTFIILKGLFFSISNLEEFEYISKSNCLSRNVKTELFLFKKKKNGSL